MSTQADHETSGRASVDLEEAMDYTPLLGIAESLRSRRLKNWASIIILAFVLVAGACIGIYLLILQSRAENIIPPEKPSTVKETANDYFDSNAYFVQNSDVRPKFVLIKAGVTQECFSVDQCIKVLEEMQKEGVPKAELSPFNLLSMSNGNLIYDHRWNATDVDPDTFAIAMIGNFSDNKTPKKYQVEAITNFITYHGDLGHFDQKYVVMVNTKANRRLLENFKNIPHFCADCKPK